MKLILEKIKYSEFNYKHYWVADIKLLNIMMGIGTNSSRYSCAFGNCHKDSKSRFWVAGDNRTIWGINETYEHWKSETNSEKIKLKDVKYKGCENKCLLNEHIGSNLILDTCMISSLHTIKLGPVNKIYKDLTAKISLHDFEDKNNIHRDPYHGWFIFLHLFVSTYFATKIWLKKIITEICMVRSQSKGK